MQEYNRRVVDTKADIDEKLAVIPEGELKSEIRLAMQAYVDANTIWSTEAATDFMNGRVVLMDFEPVRSILAKYNVPPEYNGQRIGSSRLADQKKALSIIYQDASIHLEKATDLLRN